MAAETNDPTSNLDIPEGYTVEPTEDGRFAVYCASTGAWLGNFAPALSIAQELAQELIDLHEEEKGRRELLSDLVVEPPAPGEAAGHEEDRVSEINEELQPTVDATDTARADALRIRELEIAPHLADTQEVAEELIDAHEHSEASRDDLTLLGADEGALDRVSDRRGNDALELREKALSYHAGSERKDHALRIRELEIVAGLAADSLERAGDEAAAEIVRSVLRNGSG